MSSLKGKLSKIDVNKLVADGEAKRGAGKAVEPQRTAVGMHVESIYQDRKISEENEKLRSQLVAFENANVAVKLDPKGIRASHWANRDEASFHSVEFKHLKEEIEKAGGNVQPIKVRPAKGEPGVYEIVFGHRRHRACLELGTNVLAVIEELDDAALFMQMDRENRQRADLRPYEQGVMYARALDEGLFPSQRKMADSLGIDYGGAGKLLALARLPKDVLAAFASPLDIQFAWGPLLSSAVQKDPDVVLSRAKQFAKLEPKKGAKEVFLALTSEGVDSIYPPLSKPTVLKGRAGSKATITYDPKKSAFGVRIAGVSAERLADLEQVVKKFLEK